ncbi:MAG: hypothetical protein Kow0068_01520 [Marinilabiliales bacterium]
MDNSGKIIKEINYDYCLSAGTFVKAEGRVRDSNTWQYDKTAGLYTIYRGYTGHEMLSDFDLINMNGRMLVRPKQSEDGYDPVLGRFLSPDNYVQDPYNPQNYNRYAYAYNNPLKFIDPSGEFIWMAVIVGALIGGGINWVTHSANANVWEQIGYFTVGAIAGALSTTVGVSVGALVQGGTIASGLSGSTSVYAGGGFLGGFSTGFVGNTIIETGNAMLENRKMEDKFLMKSFITGLFGGTLTGTLASFQGRNFWTGDITYNEKFNFYLAAHDSELRNEFGDELIDNTEISSKRKIFMKGGAYANTFETQSSSSQNFNGVSGSKSEIVISRKLVNLYYRSGDIRSTAAFFHEYYHANDYYSGWDQFLKDALGVDKANILLEYNTYERVFIKFGTGSTGLNYYRRLYFNNIYCY